MAVHGTGGEDLFKQYKIGGWTTADLQRWLLDSLPRLPDGASASTTNVGGIRITVDGDDYPVVRELVLEAGSNITITDVDLGNNVLELTLAATGGSGDTEGGTFLTDMGYVAHSYRQILAGTTAQTGQGQFCGVAVPVKADASADNVVVWITSAGSGTNNSYGAIYDLDGNLEASTAQIGTSLNSTGLKELALSSTWTNSSGARLVYVGIMTSATVTRPGFATALGGPGSASTVVAGPAGNFPAVVYGSGLTSLSDPATFAAGTNSRGMWAALS